MFIETNKNIIAENAAAREEENDAFRVYLKQMDADALDNSVHKLNDIVATAVDCTQCGACCQSLMINVELPEAKKLSAHFEMDLGTFKKTFVEESQQGIMVVNTIPCHFLADKKCTVYEHRFHDCRQFPHLHKPGFQGRLFGTLMHYAICPIIYNVIEELKRETGFNPPYPI